MSVAIRRYRQAISDFALTNARVALARGDTEQAARDLAQGDGLTLADRIAGEAASLLRDGLPDEAADRLDTYLRPGFSGRVAYAHSELPL